MTKRSNPKKRANSRRGTANSRFLRARTRALRSSGPYRPRRPPRPSRDTGLRNFWIIVFLVFLIFSLGQIWKAHEVARLCTRLDSLRSHQRDLEQQRLQLQLHFNEISSYAHIEPLARDRLGMNPSLHPPVVITPVNEQFIAYRRETSGNSRWGKD